MKAVSRSGKNGLEAEGNPNTGQTYTFHQSLNTTNLTTPQHLRRAHNKQKDRQPAGARRQKERKRKEEKRHGAMYVYDIFIYHSSDRPPAWWRPPCGLSWCVSKRKKEVLKKHHLKYSKSRYPGATRVRYEELGIGSETGGSHRPICWSSWQRAFQHLDM